MQLLAKDLGSSLRSSSLPVGYSFRLATQEDVLGILYFVKIGHRSFVDKVCITLLILVPILIVCIGFVFLASSLSSVTSSILVFSICFIGVFFQLVLFSIFVFFCYEEGKIRQYENYIDNEFFSIWLLEKENKIQGYILCVQYKTCTFINNILISKTHRNKGLGGYMINYVTNFYNNSIYLVCKSQLRKFYYGHGFGDAHEADLPKELSRLRGYNNSHILVSQ
jgi:N-acetylglutamate synthase-like GNAT family acetyltransferase